MSFFVPAKAAQAANAFPPDTGRYPVTILGFESQNRTDRNGCPRYAAKIKFPNGGTASVFCGVPFDESGDLVPALAALDATTQANKVNFYVGQIKEIAYSAGFTDEYMNENGIPSDHLVGRTAHIEWLGRPNDVPKGVKAYGDVKAFLTPEQFTAATTSGQPVVDERTFAWRQTTEKAPSAGSKVENGRDLPPPPARSSKKLPPPPAR